MTNYSKLSSEFSSKYELIKWAVFNDINFLYWYLVRDPDIICQSLLEKVAIIGNLPALQIIIHIGKISPSGRVSIECSTYNHKHILKWLLKNNYTIDINSIAAAAGSNHFNLVKWMLDKDFSYNEELLSQAVISGNKEMVLYLLKHINKFDHWAPNLAAKFGYIEILNLLIKYKIEPTSLAFELAAINGKLEMVKFLYNLNIFPSKDISIDVAENNHIDIIEFMIEILSVDEEVLNWYVKTYF
jgi:ankyrin repeat protein